MSCEQTLFGEDRLAYLCARGMRRSLSEMVRIVFQEIAQFSAGAFQQDDQTLLVMEVVA